MSKITFDTSQIDRFNADMKTWSSKVEDQVKENIKISTMSVKKNAMSNLTANDSVKTGQLRANIETKIDGLEGEVKAATKYAKGVEDGTKPHIIRPKNKKFLHWKGAMHPVKLVNHPGSKPKPYLIPALEKEQPILMKNLEECIEW